MECEDSMSVNTEQRQGADSATDAFSWRALLLTLALIDAVAVLAGWCRMRTPAFLLHAAGGDVLRWREALSMLLFAPILSLLLWRVFVLVNGGNARGKLGALMVLAVYLLGAGMGIHDPTNLLGTVYARTAPPALMHSLRFFDDDLGHYVFWAGFVLATVATGLAQAYQPLAAPLPWRRCGALVLLSLPMLAVMWHNLVRENTGRDVTVIVAALLFVALAQVGRRVPLRHAPILWFLYPAYAGSVLWTLACWAWSG
jgi:hypothetical protein